MILELFLSFDGTCAQVVEFYCGVFDLPAPNIMRYGDQPGAPDALRERILYTELPIGGHTVMLCDASEGFVRGNNISLTVGDRDDAVCRRLFERLSAGGQVLMPLGETFWSKCFGMVCDPFGVVWQVSQDSRP